MIDRLPPIRPAIEDEPIAGFVDSKINRQLPRYKDEFTDKLGIVWSKIVDRCDRLSGDDDNVSRGLRIDVSKGDDLSILVKDCRRDFVVRDFFEECHGAILVLSGCQLDGMSSSEFANR